MDIEVIAVKAFTCPDRGILKRSGERRQMPQFGEGLTQVEVTAGCRPVVIAALPVGQHHLKAGGGAVSQRLFMFKIHLDVSIRLVTQAPDMSTRFSGWRHPWPTLGFRCGVAHQ